MQEKQLLKKLRSGDTEAYRFLFEEYYARLCGYVTKLSGNQSLAEDLVQECLLNIWKKRKTLIITSSIKNYLFRSCHNQFLMYVRKQKKNTDLLDSIRWNTVFEVYQENVISEQKEEQINRLQALLDKLPPKCKEVFIKGKLQDLKYKEIALDMDISIKTVEAHMSKALQFLRQHAHLFFL